MAKVWRRFRGNGQITGHEGERKKDAVYSSHRGCFEPFYPAEDLTEKQQLILYGTHPNPRKNQVTVLLKKLRYYNRLEEAARVFEQYKYFYQDVHEGDPSPVEAVSILEELTPSDLKQTK